MNEIELAFGNVTKKSIRTENDFVSHMIEHIAWRLGCSIRLAWAGGEWGDLGEALGRRIRDFAPHHRAGAAMGMLDDGSAEALIDLDSRPGLSMVAGAQVDLPWFLSLRVEQLGDGQPLFSLLTGLASGLEAGLRVTVCSLEDPHHTWEGVFRAVGTALARMFTPPAEAGEFSIDTENDVDLGDIVVVRRSALGAEVQRNTAESGLSAVVDFTEPPRARFTYTGPAMAQFEGTTALDGLGALLETIARAAGFSMRIDFSSKVLSSSHVLLEDSGMALGRALREVMVKRMMDRGVNGGGDSLQTPEDFQTRPVRVAVSVEGRKFWRFVPLNAGPDEVRKKLVIGHTIWGGLLSEDLDDFIDGLSWGLGCSVVVHIEELLPPEQAWPLIFENLGLALGEVFCANPYRKGVPPGVKANLA